MDYQKPIPLKTQDNKPYWDAADNHELSLQKCDECGQYAHPPGPSCTHCSSQNMSWENIGHNVTATIYTYVISYRPFLPGFQDDLPLVIAQGQLDHAPEVKIMCNLLDCDPTDVHVGMPVKMTWKDINENRSLPQWVPAES